MFVSKCCFFECHNPAISEYIVTLKNKSKTQLILGYCDKHILDVTFGIKEQIKKINNLDDLKDIKKLEIKDLELRDVEKQKKQKTIKVVDGWEWVERYGHWMDSKGKITGIANLCDKEIEDSIRTIRIMNIQKITKRIGFVKELEEIMSPPVYVYPESAFKRDDLEEAYAKLEQFQEVMAERGILP